MADVVGLSRLKGRRILIGGPSRCDSSGNMVTHLHANRANHATNGIKCLGLLMDPLFFDRVSQAPQAFVQHSICAYRFLGHSLMNGGRVVPRTSAYHGSKKISAILCSRQRNRITSQIDW